MSKEGEIAYLDRIGPEGRKHAFNKPFSDRLCGMYLIHMGNIMSLMPPPPAKVLDLGVGTGWTSVFLGKTGYDVVGVDIAADMIDLARSNATRYEVPSLRFVVSDYEDLNFENEYDCAVFYDSLHHAEDEKSALQCAFRALKPGGVLLCHEPALGHGKSEDSVKVRELYGTTEKDMPPEHIVEIGRTIGFSSHRLYWHSWEPRYVGPVKGVRAYASIYKRKLKELLLTHREISNAYVYRNIVVLIK